MQAYARFLLTDSVEAQFDAFLAGFQQVRKSAKPVAWAARDEAILRRGAEACEMAAVLLSVLVQHKQSGRRHCQSRRRLQEELFLWTRGRVPGAQVCDGPAMSLFFPEELELLVCGGEQSLASSALSLLASMHSTPKASGHLWHTRPSAERDFFLLSTWFTQQSLPV